MVEPLFLVDVDWRTFCVGTCPYWWKALVETTWNKSDWSLQLQTRERWSQRVLLHFPDSTASSRSYEQMEHMSWLMPRCRFSTIRVAVDKCFNGRMLDFWFLVWCFTSQVKAPQFWKTSLESKLFSALRLDHPCWSDYCDFRRLKSGGFVLVHDVSLQLKSADLHKKEVCVNVIT